MTDDNEAEQKDSPYPILDEKDLSWHRFRALKRLRSDPGEAHVLYRYGRPVLVVVPEKPHSNWRIRASRFTRVASVDVRPRDLTLRGQLACRGGAHYFSVVIRLTCCVSNPESVMTGNVRNAGARLRRTLFERVGRINHEHGVDDVIRARTAILEQFPSDELSTLEPAFELTKLSVEVHTDESVQDLLRAQMEREYFETVVRRGPEAIAAHYLSRDDSNPETALKIIQDHWRELVKLRREEEEYLIRHDVVRAEQLEDRALRRLDQLELPVKDHAMAAMAQVGDGSAESITVTVHSGNHADNVPGELTSQPHTS